MAMLSRMREQPRRRVAQAAGGIRRSSQTSRGASAVATYPVVHGSETSVAAVA